MAGDGATRLRFVPNEESVGTATLRFRLWDGLYGSNGDTAYNVTSNGGETAFSAAYDEFTVEVGAFRTAG
ncbi:MAG: hypothetical protein QM775_08785 [Pirellulales bacterium]